MKGTAVITGASTGIGRALAFEFARRGYHLGLTARRLPALVQLREELLAADSSGSLRVEITTLDVDADETVGPQLSALFDALGAVDIVVVNAGINDFTSVGKGDFLREKQLLQTNLIGAIATVHAAVEYFVPRRAGHIVGISSLASLQGIPKQAAYCASKAGFSMYLDAARIELKRKNIRITKILPGFVKTSIMPHIEKYPFAVSAEQAASEMVAIIEKGKAIGFVPAYPWKWLRPLFGHFPDSIWKKLT